MKFETLERKAYSVGLVVEYIPDRDRYQFRRARDIAAWELPESSRTMFVAPSTIDQQSSMIQYLRQVAERLGYKR